MIHKRRRRNTFHFCDEQIRCDYEIKMKLQMVSLLFVTCNLCILSNLISPFPLIDPPSNPPHLPQASTSSSCGH